MKTRMLVALIPCALLFACARKEPEPTPATEANAPAPTPPDTTPKPVAPVNPPGVPTSQSGAFVTLNGAPGNAATSVPGVGGTLQLVTGTRGVMVSGTIAGLAPNSVHGFHVHEAGDCSGPDFKSAGGHFNPTGAQHGDPNTTAHHLGDIPSIKADAQGNAMVNVTITDTTLKDAGPHDILGKSLVLHAKRDDYKTQPAGDSGDRIACGVIEALP